MVPESLLSRGIYDEQAVITAPGTETFREFVVLIQNGIRMLDAQGQLVKQRKKLSQQMQRIQGKKDIITVPNGSKTV